MVSFHATKRKNVGANASSDCVALSGHADVGRVRQQNDSESRQDRSVLSALSHGRLSLLTKLQDARLSEVQWSKGGLTAPSSLGRVLLTRGRALEEWIRNISIILENLSYDSFWKCACAKQEVSFFNVYSIDKGFLWNTSTVDSLVQVVFWSYDIFRCLF